MDGAAEADTAYSPERMIITNGSQQMLYMVTEALCDEGDIVLVEDPTYFVYLGILQSHGMRGRGVRMTPDGIDVEHLATSAGTLEKERGNSAGEDALPGELLPEPDGRDDELCEEGGALKLLRQYERAAGHPIYLLEDAAYRELRFKGEDVKSALAAKGCGPGDLRGHLQQAVRDGDARGVSAFAGAGLHGGSAHQGQS